MNRICSSIKFRAAATLTYTASSSTQPSDHAEIPFSAYRLSSGRLIGQTSGAPPYIYFFNHKSIIVQQQKKIRLFQIKLTGHAIRLSSAQMNDLFNMNLLPNRVFCNSSWHLFDSIIFLGTFFVSAWTMDFPIIILLI